MTKPARSYWFFVVIITCCLLVAGVTAVVTGIEAGRQNEYLLAAQRKVVENETQGAFLEMAGKLSTESNWILAYRNVVLHWNRAWVEKEYGRYVGNIGIKHASVFGPRGELLFLGKGSGWRPSEAEVAGGSGIRELLAAVQKTWPQTKPQQRSGIVVIGGRPCFAVASAITPDEAMGADPDPALRYTLLYFAPVTVETYRSLSAVLGSTPLAIHLGRDVADGYTAVPLRDAAGRMIAHVEWQPYQPGTRLLSVLFPVMFLMLLLLALVLTQTARRWQRLQKLSLDNAARARAMEEEVRIKSAFVGNVSHELRTPLNAILGFAEMLRLHVFGSLGSPRNDEYVDHILEGGRRLLRLVDDLIEISRIEAGVNTAARETLDAAVCLREEIEVMRSTASRSKTKMTMSGDDCGAWCTGSLQNLRQVLNRLLENAMLSGGPNSEVRVFWQRTGGDVVIGINDKGEALPPEMLVRTNGRLCLFANDHKVTHKSQLGLNFTIAQGLVIMMGGSVSFQSSAEEGNTVLLRLPAMAPAAAGKAA